MLIELFEGFFVNPEEVAVVKATGEKECALFTIGQSAVDEGFHIPYAAADVAEQINDAFEDAEEESERKELLLTAPPYTEK
jgi:hypothetical protein